MSVFSAEAKPQLISYRPQLISWGLLAGVKAEVRMRLLLYERTRLFLFVRPQTGRYGTPPPSLGVLNFGTSNTYGSLRNGRCFGGLVSTFGLQCLGNLLVPFRRCLLWYLSFLLLG